MIKAIFFDVDGTLLIGNRGIPKSTLNDLKILKELGIKRVLCTGRDISEVEFPGLIDLGFDAYLTLNGQLCFDDKLNIFFSNPISKEDTEEIVKMFNKKEVPMSLCNKDGVYINFVNDYVKKAMESFNCPLEPVGTYGGEEIYKVMIFGDQKAKEYLKIDEVLKGCFTTSWYSDGMDIVPRHGGKEVGIREYLKKEKIDIRETMAFGDSENDIGMIKEVGVGVAMGNSLNCVKEVADYISSDLYDDDIDKALRYFGVIND